MKYNNSKLLKIVIYLKFITWTSFFFNVTWLEISLDNFNNISFPSLLKYIVWLMSLDSYQTVTTLIFLLKPRSPLHAFNP